MSSRPLADGAPSVWDVFVSDKRVRSSVPKGARDAWSRCLISSLADIVAHRDVKAWTDFLTLPSLVLPAPSRGGRGHVLRHEGEVRRRCLDWLSGLGADLWAPAAARRVQQRAPRDTVDASDALPESTISRVSTLIQEGLALRCKILPFSPLTMLLRPFPLLPMRTVPAWTPCAVLLPRLLRSLILIRCARPSSLFLLLLGLGGRVSCPRLLLQLLSEVVCLMLQGEVPEAVRPCVCGAPIMALRRPNGSLRPRPSAVLQARLPWISSRSMHVSFWSLFMGSRLRTDARLLSTLPASGSTATVPMRARLRSLLTCPTRSTRSTGRQCCGLSVFISLRLLRGLTAVIDMTASPSFTGSTTAASQVISSARGVQQGDPHGPVLFALAIHPIILEARAATEACTRVGVIFALFYFDDGFCAGSAQAVRRFLSALISGFRSIGLEVNLDKTEVIPACSSSQSFSPGDFQCCGWVGSSNFKLLGAPLGSSGWCEDLLGRRVGKARTLLSIGKFLDAQGVLCLLSSCSGWSKVLHSCRTVPPDVHLRGLCDADRDIRSALCHVIGAPFLMTTGAWLLSVSRLVGLGFGLLLSMPRLLMWPAFLLVAICAAFLMTGAAFLLLSPPFAAPFRPGPTSLLRSIPLRRSPCLP